MTGYMGQGLQAGGMIVGGSEECSSGGGGVDVASDHHLHTKHPHHNDDSGHDNKYDSNNDNDDHDNGDNNNNFDDDNNNSKRDSNDGVSPKLEEALLGGDRGDHQDVPSQQDIMSAISPEPAQRDDGLSAGDNIGNCQTLVQEDASMHSDDASTTIAPEEQHSLLPSRKSARIPEQKEQSQQLTKYPFLVRCRSLPSLLLRTQEGKRTTEIMYEIVELTVLNHVYMRIEYRYDSVCPFCGFRASCLRKLQKHLPRFHRDHHDFTFKTASTTTATTNTSSTSKDGIKGVCIVAVPTVAYLREKCKKAGHVPRLKDGRDQFQFVRIRNENVLLGRNGFRSSSCRTRRRRQRSHLSHQYLGTNGQQRIWTRRAIEPLEPLPDNQVWQQGSLPNPWPVPESVTNPRTLKLFRRQYCHFRDTQLPMRPGDWEFDSEDESDNEWLEEYATGGINEFTDLNNDEKKFILMWNGFFRCGTWVLPGNRSIEDRLYSFLQENIDELVDLQQQVLLKLLNLLDQQVISDSELEGLMAYFHNLVQAKEGQQQQRGDDASNNNRGELVRKASGGGHAG